MLHIFYLDLMVSIEVLRRFHVPSLNTYRLAVSSMCFSTLRESKFIAVTLNLFIVHITEGLSENILISFCQRIIVKWMLKISPTRVKNRNVVHWLLMCWLHFLCNKPAPSPGAVGATVYFWEGENRMQVFFLLRSCFFSRPWKKPRRPFSSSLGRLRILKTRLKNLNKWWAAVSFSSLKGETLTFACSSH